MHLYPVFSAQHRAASSLQFRTTCSRLLMQQLCGMSCSLKHPQVLHVFPHCLHSQGWRVRLTVYLPVKNDLCCKRLSTCFFLVPYTVCAQTRNIYHNWSLSCYHHDPLTIPSHLWNASKTWNKKIHTRTCGLGWTVTTEVILCSSQN